MATRAAAGTLCQGRQRSKANKSDQKRPQSWAKARPAGPGLRTSVRHHPPCTHVYVGCGCGGANASRAGQAPVCWPAPTSWQDSIYQHDCVIQPHAHRVLATDPVCKIAAERGTDKPDDGARGEERPDRGLCTRAAPVVTARRVVCGRDARVTQARVGAVHAGRRGTVRGVLCVSVGTSEMLQAKPCQTAERARACAEHRCLRHTSAQAPGPSATSARVVHVTVRRALAALPVSPRTDAAWSGNTVISAEYLRAHTGQERGARGHARGVRRCARAGCGSGRT